VKVFTHLGWFRVSIYNVLLSFWDQHAILAIFNKVEHLRRV